MFCTNCGAEVPAHVDTCPSCGTFQGGATASAAFRAEAKSGAIKGFFVLVLSFFTMPFKTLRLTVNQLRELGAAGTLGLGTTVIPHLSWLRVAGNFLASLVIVGILLYGLYGGVTSLEQLKYSAVKAFTGLISKPFLALLMAVAADWAIGVVLELLGILAIISNDVRTIATRQN